MAMEQTWRWFGPKDPITLAEVRQTGATGIVSALHHIPAGEIWTSEEILKRKRMIEAAGLNWSVVESVPVHEHIKKRTGNYRIYIENFKSTIRNLGQCGVDTICYNFMPVLDWSRTNMRLINSDDSITTRFDSHIFAAFDLFILKRPGAKDNYSEKKYIAAKDYFDSLDQLQIDQLIQTILLGLPGSLESYTLDEFRSAIISYSEIGDKELRANLYEFLREIIPVAEEAGVHMAIHPDDPPFSLLGLPRVVSDRDDIAQILSIADTPANGLTLCTGSLGSGIQNDLVDITEKFAHRINFVHLRNVIPFENGDFSETYHLEGNVDMYRVVKTLLIEQIRRRDSGRKDFRMPMRPDHGHLMIPELDKKGIYPGYSLFGRMRGLAEIRGLELAISRSMNET